MTESGKTMFLRTPEGPVSVQHQDLRDGSCHLELRIKP